ncbi:MAG: hypothetical protein FJ125_03890 [Deltaproteobacteria bacterium]|nr:hypothetical protein [Deltaproteobacteria bacterium]
MIAAFQPRSLLLLPALVVLLALPGSSHAAGDDEARLQILETEHKALSYRLESLKAAAAEDLRQRDLELAAMSLAAQLEQTSLAGKGDFLVLHRAFFSALFEALLPFDWEKEGVRFRFTRSELQLKPEGIVASLSFQASGEEFKPLSEQPPEGRLRCLVELVREQQPGGELSLHVRPLAIDVDDRYYKAARLLHTRFTAARFAGFMPSLPVPLSLPEELSWEGKRQKLEVKIDPSRQLVLPDQVLLPFGLKAIGVPEQPPEPPAAAPSPPPVEQPKIPIGLTPDSVKR